MSQLPKKWTSFAGILSFWVVLVFSGCASGPGPQRASDPQRYDNMSPYGYPTQRRQYGPWDMQQGTQMQQPGPPTWYGCPQQSARCYSE